MQPIVSRPCPFVRSPDFASPSDRPPFPHRRTQVRSLRLSLASIDLCLVGCVAVRVLTPGVSHFEQTPPLRGTSWFSFRSPDAAGKYAENQHQANDGHRHTGCERYCQIKTVTPFA